MGSSDQLSNSDSKRLACILALDICDFSKLAEADEDTAIAVVKRLRTLVVDISKQFDGRLFHEAGDAFLFEFSSASQTMSCAKEILKQVSLDIELHALAQTKVRIGLHTGDVNVQEDENLLGHGVNIAARLQQNAQPGSILASKNLIDALSSKQPTKHSKRKVTLKNIKKPIIAFDVYGADKNAIMRLFRSVLRAAMSRLTFIASSIAIVATLTFYWALSAPPTKKINPSAVSATLYHLQQTPYPIEDVFSALNNTNNFESALEQLTRQYDAQKDEMNDREKIALLHQIAALAVNRNTPEAEKAYRTILGIRNDPEALLQLAVILRKRGDIMQAREFLQRGYETAQRVSYSPDRLMLAIRIERALIDGQYGPSGNATSEGTEDDYISAEAALEEIANSRRATAHKDLALRASYSRLKLTHLRTYNSDNSALKAENPEMYVHIIRELKKVISQQEDYKLLYELSDSISTLSAIQNFVGQFEDAISSLNRALKVEELLHRPTKTISTHANLAYAYAVWESDEPKVREQRFRRAAFHIEQVRRISEQENRQNREYYNSYILALIEHGRGNSDTACNLLDMSRDKWPNASLSKQLLEHLDRDFGCGFYVLQKQ